MKITGSTQVVGIIGDPVTHSRSPAMHNAAFAALGLDMAYVPLPVRPPDVASAVKGLAALGFRGANVTVPHKGAVLPHLSWLHEDARRAEAVNTIVVDKGLLLGYNTDIEGARRALVGVCGEEALRDQPALLLGAGGAARAVALALARLGMAITVVNRTLQSAEHLIELVQAAEPDTSCRCLPLDALNPSLVKVHHLLVNATTLGMAGAGKVPASLVDTVSAGQIVFEVVYGDTETDLLATARERGARTVDGLAMLVGQAAEAFQLWTGRMAPLDVMQAAAGCRQQQRTER